MACCLSLAADEKGRTVANRVFATATRRRLRGAGFVGPLAALVLVLGFSSATGAARTSDDQRNSATIGAAAVSAGGGHSCGLRTDGTVSCWGDNSDGQASAPAGTFSAVSAGGVHS